MLTQFPVAGYPLTEGILDIYGFNDKSYWGCVFMLLALFIIFRVLVIVSLACQDRKRTHNEHDTRNTNINLIPRKGAQQPLIEKD